jgi:ABC-2 type transport system ATP-binding protein
VIEVRDLVFEYPTKRALFGVSVDVARGAIAALVGPNGAGKTTLLRCIAALERPYSGSVKIDGIDVQEKPRAAHAKLGFLPDFYGLYGDLTVRRALTFAARAHGLSARAAPDAVTRAARRVGLEDRLAEAAATLSRGLRQRLAIAQAIVHEPSVLLLDEPASGLDPEARRALSRLLLELQGQGMTLIVSSHILSELDDYSTEMIIMDGGRILGDRARAIAGKDAPTHAVELSEPKAGLGAFLSRWEGVSGVQESAQGAEFVFAGDARACHALLRALIEAGFPVSSFGASRRRLQELYFAEVEAERKDK